MFISTIFGIILAVAFIVIYQKIAGENFQFKNIEVEIESYHSTSTNVGHFTSIVGFGYLHGVTLKNLKTGERKFIRLIKFEKVLWKNIGATDFRQRKCTLCTQKTLLTNFKVFALKFIDNTSSPGYAFLSDLHIPRSIFGLIYGMIWRLAFLFFTITIIFPDAINTNISMLFFPLFLSIILLHSLYKFALSISKLKVAFQEQLALIEEAGIPRPLG